MEEAEADDDLNEVLGEKVPVPVDSGSSEPTPSHANHEESEDKDDVDNEVQGDKVTEKCIVYRVTHQVEPNLPLTSKQKFRFDVNGRFGST